MHQVQYARYAIERASLLPYDSRITNGDVFIWINLCFADGEFKISAFINLCQIVDEC